MHHKNILLISATTRLHDRMRELSHAIDVSIALANEETFPQAVSSGHEFDLVILDGEGMSQDLLNSVDSFVAENERVNIRQRQAEGIAAAKARGIHLGRPPEPLPENFHQVYQKWKSGRITGAEAAKECSMPPTTFRYKAKIYEKATLL